VARPRERSPYARLHQRAYAALQSAGVMVHGYPWGVFGLGDPRLPLMGWCPVCRAGTVDIWLLDTDPPRLRTDGCTNGCSPDLIFDAL
jgi:hypothetical protein